jgi:hypothetical protein
VLSSPPVLEIRLDIYHKSALNYDDLSVYSSGVLSLMKKDKMSKRKKAITDYFMQSKKLNKGEDSMKTCQIMLFGVGIASYPFFFLISVVICVNERRKFSVLS